MEPARTALEPPGAAHVRDAFKRGINPGDSSVLGYHGTSVQALEEAIRTGTLPVTKGAAGVFGDDRSYKGATYGIHLVPNPLNEFVKDMSFRNPPFDDPMKDALDWARFIAERHHIMKTKGLDLSKIRHHRAADDIMNLIDPLKATKGMKLLRPEPGAPRAGVVLAISEEAARKFRIGVGGDGNDINIMSRGLPVSFVKGIEPADDEAFRWLDALSPSESFRSWLSYRENPVLRRVAESLSRQKKMLEERYGKKRADRIVAIALLTGAIPVPGVQVALLLAMLGISEAQRLMRRGSREDHEIAAGLGQSGGSLNAVSNTSSTL